MIRSTAPLDALEARERRAADRSRTYNDALAIYSALWVEARLLNADLGADWVYGVQADVNIARALRGLPPAA